MTLKYINVCGLWVLVVSVVGVKGPRMVQGPIMELSRKWKGELTWLLCHGVAWLCIRNHHQPDGFFF